MSEITVNDRRLFTKAGEIKDQGQPDERVSEKAPGTGAEKPAGIVPEPGTQETKAQPQPESPKREKVNPYDLKPTFSSLVLGLATSVMINLGEHSPDDKSPPPPPDFPAAKHSIDLMGVLEEKTKGNLDNTEEQLLKTLLYDLRLQYVGKVRQ
ncbi:MAG: DUF1844 domain-containing protein [Deltaproteobacteria bacterium]|jgi:hypothetical protein|nr:DUF1844 domain-containing protein [Deltaproteobacteria bacterium]